MLIALNALTFSITQSKTILSSNIILIRGLTIETYCPLHINLHTKAAVLITVAKSGHRSRITLFRSFRQPFKSFSLVFFHTIAITIHTITRFHGSTITIFSCHYSLPREKLNLGLKE